MSGRLRIAACCAVLAGIVSVYGGAAGAQTPTSGGGGASTQRENHLNHDRWARGEQNAPHARKHDDGDGDSSDADNHPATSGPHKGELNGKLHMGDWT